MPPWTHKLSAGLSLALQTPPVPAIPSLFLSRGIVPTGLQPSSPNPDSLEVFLRCDPEADIEVPDVHICQLRGSVRTAVVPSHRIAELASHPRVRHLTESVQLKPSLDVALPLIRVPGFRHRTGFSGQGVILGIVDSGIDTSHPAFAGRVLMVWDQTRPGTGRGRFRKGRVLTGAELGRSTDESGHGTHVAGIAAGNDPTYAGVAPGAQLIVAKTTFANSDIGDAIHFIFEEAARLGRPAVVNLSLGGHHDAHDGTDDLSALIDDVSGPGRIVVAAAGNEGEDPIHARVTVPPGGQATLPMVVLAEPSLPPASQLVLNGWYTGRTRCSVQLVDPAGNTTSAQLPSNSDASGQAVSTTRLGSAWARIVSPPAEAAINGDHQFIVELVAPRGSALRPGTWNLQLHNAGSETAVIDVWLPNAHLVGFPASVATRNCLVGSPACATQAIAVGAFVSRNHWIDQAGQLRQFQHMPAGSMAGFSSPGPRRDGHPKPDICAPGAFLVSCRSSDAEPHPDRQVHPQWIAMPGTSMASPVVAGLVALLLESNPDLTPEQVRARLIAASAIPGRPPAGGHDPHWGWGLIDTSRLIP